MGLYYFKTMEEKTAAQRLIEEGIQRIYMAADYPEIFPRLEDREFSLVGTGLSPCKTTEILNELGYKQSEFDSNGWEGETWITFTKEGSRSIILYYEGWDFDIKIQVYEDD